VNTLLHISAIQTFYRHGTLINSGFGRGTRSLRRRNSTLHKLFNGNHCDVAYRNLTNILRIQTIVMSRMFLQG